MSYFCLSLQLFIANTRGISFWKFHWVFFLEGQVARVLFAASGPEALDFFLPDGTQMGLWYRVGPRAEHTPLVLGAVSGGTQSVPLSVGCAVGFTDASVSSAPSLLRGFSSGANVGFREALFSRELLVWLFLFVC